MDCHCVFLPTPISLCVCLFHVSLPRSGTESHCLSQQTPQIPVSISCLLWMCGSSRCRLAQPLKRKSKPFHLACPPFNHASSDPLLQRLLRASQLQPFERSHGCSSLAHACQRSKAVSSSLSPDHDTVTDFHAGVCLSTRTALTFISCVGQASAIFPSPCRVRRSIVPRPPARCSPHLVKNTCEVVRSIMW